MIRLLSQDEQVDINYANYDIRLNVIIPTYSSINKWRIIATPNFHSELGYVVLAKYKTEEKAMKVLEDMRNTLYRKHDDLEVLYYTFPEDLS